MSGKHSQSYKDLMFWAAMKILDRLLAEGEISREQYRNAQAHVGRAYPSGMRVV